MSGKKITRDEIIKWLTEHKKRNKIENVLDFKWEVEEADENTLLASLPEIGLNLIIEIEEDFINISLPTGFETATLPNKDRLDIYRKLLLLSDRFMMTKLTLYGLGDEVLLRTDLDRHTLGKKEFADAIESLLFTAEAVGYVLSSHEKEEESEEETYVPEDLEGNPTFEEIKNALIEVGGLAEEDAIAVATSIVLKKEKKRYTGPPQYA